MRKVRLVADSSADIYAVDGVEFAQAPLKICTSEREFVDNEALDTEVMVKYLDGYKGRSTTSCPNAEDWILAFGDAEEVYCVTMTSTLSGTYNSACLAKRIYEKANEGRRVCVIDSLSTGPEMSLILHKIAELVREERSFDEICAAAEEYKSSTGLLFMLESMKNLANNGRVSKIVAKIAGIMGIRVVGKASDKGDLEPLDKPRGLKTTLTKISERLVELGYRGGKMIITHCLNLSAAEALKEKMQQLFHDACISVRKCGGLCSFYAEQGGLLIGFEKA